MRQIAWRAFDPKHRVAKTLKFFFARTIVASAGALVKQTRAEVVPSMLRGGSRRDQRVSPVGWVKVRCRRNAGPPSLYALKGSVGLRAAALSHATSRSIATFAFRGGPDAEWRPSRGVTRSPSDDGLSRGWHGTPSTNLDRRGPPSFSGSLCRCGTPGPAE
jgi:hypothetical protein